MLYRLFFVICTLSLLAASSLAITFNSQCRKLQRTIERELPNLMLAHKSLLTNTCIIRWRDRSHVDGTIEFFYDRDESEANSHKKFEARVRSIGEDKSIVEPEFKGFWTEAGLIRGNDIDSKVILLRHGLETFTILSHQEDTIRSIEKILRQKWITRV